MSNGSVTQCGFAPGARFLSLLNCESLACVDHGPHDRFSGVQAALVRRRE